MALRDIRTAITPSLLLFFPDNTEVAVQCTFMTKET